MTRTKRSRRSINIPQQQQTTRSLACPHDENGEQNNHLSCSVRLCSLTDVSTCVRVAAAAAAGGAGAAAGGANAAAAAANNAAANALLQMMLPFYAISGPKSGFCRFKSSPEKGYGPGL